MVEVAVVVGTAVVVGAAEVVGAAVVVGAGGAAGSAGLWTSVIGSSRITVSPALITKDFAVTV